MVATIGSLAVGDPLAWNKRYYSMRISELWKPPAGNPAAKRRERGLLLRKTAG